MARPRIHVRVIDLPDGTLEPTKRKSRGCEITRLSFHKGNHGVGVPIGIAAYTKEDSPETSGESG